MGLSRNHFKEEVAGLPGQYRDSLLPCTSASQGGLAAPPLTLQNSSPHLTQAVTQTSPKHLTQPGRPLLLPVAPGPPPPECPNLLTHPTNLQTQQPQLTHWARNQKSVRTNGHLGRKLRAAIHQRRTNDHKAWKAHNRIQPDESQNKKHSLTKLATKTKKAETLPPHPPPPVPCAGRCLGEGHR